MGCTPKIETYSCRYLEAFEGTGCGAEFKPADQEAVPQWSENPLERNALIRSHGLPSICKESSELQMVKQDEYRKLTGSMKKDAYQCGPFSVVHFEGLTSEEELGNLCDLATGLHQLFPTISPESIAYTGKMSGSAILGSGPITLSVMHRDEHVRLGRYVHEFGQRVFSSKFGIKKDPDLDKLLLASWYEQNYLIIKDSTYVHPELTMDALGHINSEDELFASSVFSFYYEGDQLASFIADPGTPPPMRSFGAAMWSYMRDKMFDGRVFTEDGFDPFPDTSYERYIANMTFDPNEIIIQRYMGGDYCILETGSMMSFVDLPSVFDKFAIYLEETASNGTAAGLRSFLFECSGKDNQKFISIARELLRNGGRLSRGARPEMLNLAGLHWGVYEKQCLDLLADVFKSSPSKLEKRFIAYIITDHIKTYESEKAQGEEVFLTDEFVGDLKTLVSE